MSRADRRSRWKAACPECGAGGLGWLTLDEFLAHARLTGRSVRVEAGTLAEVPWLPPYQWWWCHECDNGGLLLTA